MFFEYLRQMLPQPHCPYRKPRKTDKLEGNSSMTTTTALPTSTTTGLAPHADRGPNANSLDEPTKTTYGKFSRKEGPLNIDEAIWKTKDPLSQWRGTVNGEPTGPNILSSPSRVDGLAIFRGADPAGSFEKDDAKVPHKNLVYTEGNWWPDAKGGAVKGKDIVAIENRTGGGIIFAGSHTPGYEQPGAALTAVKAGEKGKFVPTPPQGFLESVGLGDQAQPQVWVSVKNVNPATIEGWHESDARPNDDPKSEDHGTPAFPYGFIVIDNGPEANPTFSMSTSEGYDPRITQEPGYGMYLVAVDDQGQEEFVAAVALENITEDNADGVAWGAKDWGMHAEQNGQGGVTVGGELNGAGGTAFSTAKSAASFKTVLAPRAEVLKFIAGQEDRENSVVARGDHAAVDGEDGV